MASCVALMSIPIGDAMIAAFTAGEVATVRTAETITDDAIDAVAVSAVFPAV